MRFLVFGVVLQVSCTAMAGGCGGKTETIPLCRDVDWVGRSGHAQLTGAPTFSSLEIAPGDPLSIAVPVDVNTRSVRVIMVSKNQLDVGSGGEAETNGSEIVDVLMGDTNLPAGIYFAETIRLEGDGDLQRAVYIADPESQYVLSIPAEFNAHGTDYCLTDIPPPTVLVTSNASERP